MRKGVVAVVVAVVLVVVAAGGYVVYSRMKEPSPLAPKPSPRPVGHPSPSHGEGLGVRSPGDGEKTLGLADAVQQAQQAQGGDMSPEAEKKAEAARVEEIKSEAIAAVDDKAQREALAAEIENLSRGGQADPAKLQGLLKTMEAKNRERLSTARQKGQVEDKP